MSFIVDSKLQEFKLYEKVEKIIESLKNLPSNFQINELLISLKTYLLQDNLESIESIPKILIILYPYFDLLKKIHSSLEDSFNRRYLADIISLLATVCKSVCKDTLKYRLIGTNLPINYWGEEYISHLITDIINEFRENSFSCRTQNELGNLVRDIAEYYFKHNSVIEGMDFLIETKQLSLLESIFITKNDATRKIFYQSAVYLRTCASYVDDPKVFNYKAIDLFILSEYFIDALILALKIGKCSKIYKIFDQCKDSGIIKQMCFILARQTIFTEYHPTQEDLKDLISNKQLNQLFLKFAAELGIIKPKDPRTIFQNNNKLDQNLTSRTYVPMSFFLSSALLNCGFGNDFILKNLIHINILRRYKLKDVSYLISLFGFLNLWNIEKAIEFLNTFNKVELCDFKCGAILACGISLCGVKDQQDLYSKLTWNELENQSFNYQLCAAIGLGVRYSGSNRNDVLTLLLSIVCSSKTSIILKGIASLSCGLISIGFDNKLLQNRLFQELLKLDKLISNLDQLVTSWFFLLGIGFCFLGVTSNEGYMLDKIELLTNKNLKFIAFIIFVSCEYAFSGNVLKIQQLLKIISLDINCIDEFLKSNMQQMKAIENEFKNVAVKNKIENIESIQKPTKKVKSKKKKKKILKNTEMSSFKEILEHFKTKQTDNMNTSLNEFYKNHGRSKKKKQKHLIKSKSEDNSLNELFSQSDSEELNKLFLSCESLDLTHPLKHKNSCKNELFEETHNNDQINNLINALELLNKNLCSILNNQQKFVSSKVHVSSISKFEVKSIAKALAVLGISLITFGEEVGSKMAHRIFFHILQEADTSAKKMIPLAFALLSQSDPKMEIIQVFDQIKHTKLSELIPNMIVSLGIIGAGTNNTRITSVLQELRQSYKTGPGYVMKAINLARGLLGLGKGTLCLNALRYDKKLISKTSVGSFLIIAFACLDNRSILFGKLNHLINYLAPAIHPRMVLTLDEETLEPVTVCAQIGKPKDILDQVGEIKLISSYNSFNTPLIWNPDEKIQLVSKEYIPLTSIVENIVLMRKISK